MNSLTEVLADLNEEQGLSEVKAMEQQGEVVGEIIHDLREGMHLVGKQFGAKTYYRPELIMSTYILK